MTYTVTEIRVSPPLARDKVLGPVMPSLFEESHVFLRYWVLMDVPVLSHFLEKSPDPFLHAGSTLEPVTQAPIFLRSPGTALS